MKESGGVVIEALEDMEEGVFADVSFIDAEGLNEHETEVLERSLMSQFEKYVRLSKKVPNEVLASLSSIKRNRAVGRYYCRAYVDENRRQAEGT